ncbi:MAG: hypothetical protein H6741_00575 [Alphaproteobacteria bacterium]|nr:hypothetical protein [Alphaproteobacteria bacterium]MCB9791199.1 hypothetical protein [Alphaproteobacteria bacterium]
MRTDRSLVFYRAGLLDPAQAAEVEARLEASPGLRAALAALDQRWTPEVEVSVPLWRIPPPGLGVGASAGLPAVFSESSLRPGDRFHVRIDPLPEPERRRVVVLRRHGRAWDVVFPTRAAHELHLHQLEQEGDGSYRLDLTARGPAGRQRWAVALPWAEKIVDWDSPDEARWGELRQAVATGKVPVASVEITVSEA